MLLSHFVYLTKKLKWETGMLLLATSVVIFMMLQTQKFAHWQNRFLKLVKIAMKSNLRAYNILIATGYKREKIAPRKQIEYAGIFPTVVTGV